MSETLSIEIVSDCGQISSPLGSTNSKGGRKVIKKWSEEEDNALISLVKIYGTKCWALIASKLNQNRTGKQCRERWHNQLDPTINKDAWSEEEEKLLMEAQSRLGNCWAEIAKCIPGRTDNTVKNHWNSAKRRLTRKEKDKEKSSPLKMLKNTFELDEASDQRSFSTDRKDIIKNESKPADLQVTRQSIGWEAPLIMTNFKRDDIIAPFKTHPASTPAINHFSISDSTKSTRSVPMVSYDDSIIKKKRKKFFASADLVIHSSESLFPSTKSIPDTFYSIEMSTSSEGESVNIDRKINEKQPDEKAAKNEENEITLNNVHEEKGAGGSPSPTTTSSTHSSIFDPPSPHCDNVSSTKLETRRLVIGER